MIDTETPTTGSRSARLAWRLGAILVAPDLADDGSGTPRAEPHFVIGFAGFLPGLLVLALATVFRHGEELRRFSQETV